MSELIEQLAKQFTQPIEVRHSDDEIGDFHTEYSFDVDQLEAFAKAYQAAINNKGDYKEYSQDDAPANYQHAEAFAWASGAMHGYVEGYQAAAPIDNVAEALEKAASICESYKDTEYPEMARDIQDRIRKLIPTQANRTEG
jgi:hypothetical protein